MERIGDWLLTAAGTQWWPCDPRPEEVSFAAVAHHCATINRFGGAANPPYSVAEHSVRVMRCVEALGGSLQERRWALVHDAHEGLIGIDPPRPVKRGPIAGAAIVELERINQLAIILRLHLPIVMPPIVKEADNILLMTERRDVMPPHHVDWKEQAFKPLRERITPWRWYKARQRFVHHFLELFDWERTDQLVKWARYAYPRTSEEAKQIARDRRTKKRK